MHLKLTLAAGVAALTLFAATSAMAAPGVALRAVNIREDAGTEYDIIGRLKKGEFVEIVECNAGWCEITDDGEEGYVSASYLALVDYDDEEDEDDDHDHGHHDDADVEVCIGGGGFGGGGFGYGELCIED
ncbi:MAG TPA: SH3 domain-containing protein [Alphaproteobacteria bacterium]|nr:SH3 domain-containing protein [Alphaproteobacteria bacterium]